MRRAAIVSPIRTGVGRYLGALGAFGAEDLGALVIRDLMTRTGLDPERVDEVVFAQGYPSGEAPCIGRWAALAADLPLSVSGTRCTRCTPPSNLSFAYGVCPGFGVPFDLIPIDIS